MEFSGFDNGWPHVFLLLGLVVAGGFLGYVILSFCQQIAPRTPEEQAAADAEQMAELRRQRQAQNPK